VRAEELQRESVLFAEHLLLEQQVAVAICAAAALGAEEKAAGGFRGA